MMLPHQKEIAESIMENECFLRQDASIVFVCGRDTKSPDSRRRLFLEYAQKHIQGFHFLLAEDLFKIKWDAKTDLLTIEKQLTNYSDCIVIILESESAFTELGAFAASDELCPLILPINDRKHSTSTSFINQGPLKKINSWARGLGPTINADMRVFTHCFREIQTRLDSIKKLRRERLCLWDVERFSSEHKRRLLFLYDLINLLAPISRKDIFRFLEQLYGKRRYDNTHLEIQILIALNLVSEREGYLFSINPMLQFLEFKRSHFQIKTDTLLHYKKNNPDRLSLLGTIASDAR